VTYRENTMFINYLNADQIWGIIDIISSSAKRIKDFRFYPET